MRKQKKFIGSEETNPIKIGEEMSNQETSCGWRDKVCADKTTRRVLERLIYSIVLNY